MSETPAREDSWIPRVPAGRVDATVELPGSKSMTNRAYVLAALADGPSTVRKPLRARDTQLMLSALEELGTERVDAADEVELRPLAESASPPRSLTVDLGNSGTVTRFTPALAALTPHSVRFDGDDAIRRRPVAPLLQALRQLGVDIDDAGRGAPPFTVRGHGGLTGATVELDSSASSQFLSALLLVAPCAQTGITIRLVGELPSEPHIAMTLDMLRARGVAAERDGREFHVAAGRPAHGEHRVEPDLSTAAPFVLGALATGGTVRIPGWPEHTTQPGDWLRDFARDLGAQVDLDSEGLTVTGSDSLPGATLDLHDVGELTPVVAALLCFAEESSLIRGVAHLRGHETDRLDALAAELSARGAKVTQTEDGLRITPAPLHGGPFRTYEDHRLVMAAALLGLRVDGIQVENPGTVGKTFPGFLETWQAMLGTAG